MTSFDRRGGFRAVNFWPGFVDALAALLMVIIFVLLVFVVAQFYMSSLLRGRESELADALALAAQRQQEIGTLRSGIEALESTRKDLEAQVASYELALQNAKAEAAQAGVDLGQQTSLNALLRQNLEQVAAAKAELEQQAVQAQAEAIELHGRLQLSDNEIVQLRDLLASSEQDKVNQRNEVETLRSESVDLKEQLARLEAALAQSAVDVSQRDVEIRNLNARLNEALVRQVEELNRYRSEFFGRMRDALADRADVQIVGDRFVFQSEVLFPSGSDELTPSGQQDLARFAQELLGIAQQFPTDVDWILRVDGHTDKRPLRNNARFRSNWELSAARALSVVQYLIAAGVPPERLAAAGFGEYQPIDPGDDDAAYERNRRIELKLDQR